MATVKKAIFSKSLQEAVMSASNSGSQDELEITLEWLEQNRRRRICGICLSWYQQVVVIDADETICDSCERYFYGFETRRQY